MPKSRHATEVLLKGFFDLYPGEAATLLEGRPVPEIIRLLKAMPVRRAADVFEQLAPDAAAGVLEAMQEETAAALLAELEPARAVPALARLDPEMRERRLAPLPAGRAQELRALLAYPPDSAGGLMDPQVTTFHPQATVRDALARLRAGRARRTEVFLVEPDGRLGGMVALEELALAAPGEPLEAVARPAPPAALATTSREGLLELFEQGGLASVPVVDFEGRLLGVVRSEALVAAAREEVTADLQTMVGASKDERALSSPLLAVRKRLPWLEINLCTAFLAAGVVGLFENTIARFTALAVLMPVVAGQSGNTGAQALAVTMRGLALREIRLRHWLRVSLKEATVGLLNGVVVALTTGLAVYAWSRSSGLALVITAAMVLSMVVAGLAGATIPMLLTAARQDPAQSSSIVLTTVTDVVGFFSFLGIATLLAELL